MNTFTRINGFSKPLPMVLTGIAAAFFLGVSTVVTSAAVPTTPGTPDDFGYKFAVSSDTTQYNFIDLINLPQDSVVHTASALLNQDDAAQNIDIGFGFVYYATTYTSCFPSTNGEIVFGASSVDYSPEPIFGPELPHNYIAPFFTDLTTLTSPAPVPTIKYATLGAAPNRICVVQWQDMQQYAYAANRMTFQVQLYEGSNEIRFVYKTSPAFTAVSYKAISIGIEGPTAFPTGLQYLFGHQGDSISLAGKAIMITRPVKVTVESKYTRPDGTTVVVGASNPLLLPTVGVTNQAYQSVQRFSAPDFIYLNAKFAELTAPGDPDDPNPDNIGIYRLRNLGYAIDGQTVQGVQNFFEQTVNGDMKVIWRWALEYAVIIDSATGKDGGFGHPDPGVGRFWYALNSQFTASIDTVVQNDAGGVRIKNTGYSVTTYAGANGASNTPPAYPLTPGDTRAVTAGMQITAPLRIQWQSTGQVRYRFDATSIIPGQTAVSLDGQSFVRVFDTGGPHVVYGSGLNSDVWINSESSSLKVEVGVFYRTTSRRLTLADFPVPPGGDLSPLGSAVAALTDETVADKDGVPRTARVYILNPGAPVVGHIPTPTEIHWLFQQTVFRALVPAGTALDRNLPATNPALPDGVLLGDSGPDSTALEPVGDMLTGSATGWPWAWDQVNQKLYPVHPASFRVVWQEQYDHTKTYKIEIVSGYPGQTVNLTSALENAVDFSRIKSGTQYVMQAALPTIAQSNPDAAFPAQFLGGPSPALSEDAHYHHLFDPVAGRQPPTKLDLSATDAWKFQNLTYTDLATAATADKASAGVPFSAAGAGRSVVLYSYRANPGEVATGDLTKEGLAVRVIRSSPVTPLLPDDPKLILGRRGLELGGGTAADHGALGVITGASQTAIDPGSSFVIDFWLNAKSLRDFPTTLTNCTTTASGTTVTCDGTSSLVPGMTVSGSNIAPGTKVVSVTNGSTFVLSVPAAAAGSGLSLTASGKPMTILSTGGGNLTVVMDPVASTITTHYMGMLVTKAFTTAGSAWKHHVIHVFTDNFFGIPLTVLDYYLDGVRDEAGSVDFLFDPSGITASNTVGASLTDQSLRLGVDVNPLSHLQLDQFRMFGNLASLQQAVSSSPWLTPAEILNLRSSRTTTLRTRIPLLQFGFEAAPLGNLFVNEGSLPNVGVGPVPSDTRGVYAGTWAHLDIQEVATRLDSTLDNAGFGGSGYILNAVSNYNADVYTRSAEVGAWGPIFPVNHGQLYASPTRRLEVAYYENPYLTDPLGHPNVAWPYTAAGYDEVKYPTYGPNKDKAIYIASRIGSEGIDQTGRPQQVFDLTAYASLKIYNQPDNTLAGYNPNEEHALVAPSGRASLKIKNLGEDIPNTPPLAAFALQADINTSGTTYTSDPWVLAQVSNLVTGEPEMAAYHVFKNRPGTVDFPRPADAVVLSTPGLAYESAAHPEDRFLTTDASKSYNFRYNFRYQAYAGDSLVPPYPLNLVIGNVAMPARGGNSASQRALWWDVNANPWVVSGNGIFFYQFHYPFRNDFYLPNTAIGAPVAWVPDAIRGVRTFNGDTTTDRPGKVVYKTFWRSDYPKLKRGETLAYQGGEYFNENPGANGLPALVAMKAAEIVYDVATPSMVIGDDNVNSCSARIVRPLDRMEAPFTVAQMAAAGFSPASASIFTVAERWYFKDLPGSLSKRFYFDSLAATLVFRGYLNDKDSGNKDLTVGPDPLNILEPNLMTADEFTRVQNIGTGASWLTAVTGIYQKSKNPMLIRNEAPPDNPPVTGQYLAGLKESPVVTLRIGLNNSLYDATADLAAQANALAAQANLTAVANQGFSFIEVPQSTIPVAQSTADASEISALDYQISLLPTQAQSRFSELDSFGVGSSLVPNPALLTAPTSGGSRFITIAENNRTELAGAPVGLHIIEIIPDRYRGAIKVIESADAFSEKITLQHNGEFGANTADLYYEWWIRDAAPLGTVATEVMANGTLKQTDSSGHSLWQQYLPKDRMLLTDVTAQHLGLHSIVFEGRPDVVLADKLILMRYRHKTEANWTLVPFEVANAAIAWKPGGVAPTSNAPFQWAGAANSPQLQADGSKNYIPQLVMGWVKRVLDRINPYEARYTDFFNSESPATYSSQIQIAGAPFAGMVALNPDKNVIERTGLIELYQTVLARARQLSIDNSTNAVSTDGINQALLLAATRLATLYDLLAREAYSDAQDSTIAVTSDSSSAGLASVAPYTFAFQGMVADVMQEELALLRGTDFLKSYPVYNRLFWNYSKGLGEAAYNVNYNIADVNQNGFINEDDARLLYPQGHGDAWGHFLSALGMHYTLLQDPNFHWLARSELYSLMQNVLPVDYLDEKTFAREAAGKAQAGRDIVRATYRQYFTQNSDGQWQGYTDGADPARAWGVSEWAHRAGQGAWFDNAVANALLPAQAPPNAEDLDLIERSGATADIGSIVGSLHEIQIAMDEANSGVNPLGFDSDAIAMDLDPSAVQSGNGHFSQMYQRAVSAAGNALATLDLATKAGNKLRYLADDTSNLSVDAVRQDLDYRNRLIEIFGTPYTGTIGFGKAFPEGYAGPDTQLFSYLEETNINQIIPQSDQNAPTTMVTFASTSSTVANLADSYNFQRLYGNVFGNAAENLGNVATKLIATPLNLFGVSASTTKVFTFGAGSSELTAAFGSFLNTQTYEDFSTTTKQLVLPVRQQSPYAFQAPASWGQRTSYGKVQQILENELKERIALDSSIKEYQGFLQEFQVTANLLDSEITLSAKKGANVLELKALEALAAKIKIAQDAGKAAADVAAATVEKSADGTAEAIPKALPTVGFAISPGDVLAPVRGVAKLVAVVTSAVKTAAGYAFTALKTAGQVLLDAQIDDLKTEEGRMTDVIQLQGTLVTLVGQAAKEGPLRDAIGTHLQELQLLQQQYLTAQSEGFRLLKQRESFNKTLAAKVQRNRYQDMIFRMARNEALAKYEASFNNAARYAWLTARAYDFETSLDPGHPAAPGQMLDQIVKERQLGLWTGGQPQAGQGGLAEILNHLNGNYQVLKGQLGINNPQSETEKISLRAELFRIKSLDPAVASVLAMYPPSRQAWQSQLLTDNATAITQAAASDARWVDALKTRIVPDLRTIPEYMRYCRPFSTTAEGPQAGLVIRFGTTINNGVNFFGLPLATGDHKYSTANFATKILGFGVWLDNYNAAGLSTSPRAYLVPVGNDYLRLSSSGQPVTRMWSVVDQLIPTPFTINQSNLIAPGYIPTLDGVDGFFGEVRHHGDFRMYHNNGGTVSDSELVMDSRLIGRSVWNSQWLLIIPGAGLAPNALDGVTRLANSIADVKLYFKTYSHQGQ